MYLHKHVKIEAIAPAIGEGMVVFNPRPQTWPEHFMLDKMGDMRGLTPIDRASVKALNRNA